jgi:hypothetical protein
MVPAAPAASAKLGTASLGKAVFPDTVDKEFSTLPPAQQRLKTCSKQFQANKATGGNAELKWIQSGGGYWSECNKHIKG